MERTNKYLQARLDLENGLQANKQVTTFVAPIHIALTAECKKNMNSLAQEQLEE